MLLCYRQDDEVENSLSSRQSSPNESYRFECNGKDIYDLVEEMKELGLYKAETRPE